MTDIEKALLLTEDRDKILAIGKIIGRKIPSTDNFDHLNDFERTFVYIDILEGQVTNGGFEQFFFNTSGAFTHEILQAYQNIGATRTAEILYKAISLFPSLPVPKDITTRRHLLLEKESNTFLWDKLDVAFEKDNENITRLLIEFIRENLAAFE